MFSLTVMKNREMKTTMTLHFSPTKLAKILKNILTMEYSEISTFIHCYKSVKWYDIFGKQSVKMYQWLLRVHILDQFVPDSTSGRLSSWY